MIVVADTSPLNYVVQLGLVSEFHAIYGEVVVPQAVHRELLHPGSPLLVQLWAASLPEWIEVKQASVFDATLPSHLGIGEREAISLAIELNAAMLIVDDLAGRKAVKARRIPVTGTLTFLWQAALLSRLDFEAKLEELNKLGFRASESVLEGVRQAFKARRQSTS